MKTAVMYASSVAAARRSDRSESKPGGPVHLLEVPAPVTPLAEASVARWGRHSVSPFLAGPGTTMVRLGAGAAGYLRQGRWAVLATDPAAPMEVWPAALDELLDHLDTERLLPVFACVEDPEPYQTRGMYTIPVAEDALIDLACFSLSGKRRASVRHSVSAAERAGVVVVPFSDQLADGAAKVSAAWLTTKRSGEMGFTLGRFDVAELASADARVAVDAEGRVVGFVTWRRFDAGRGRVLDLMRRAPDAPNPTMDVLIARSLFDFAAQGVERASLASVPLSRGRLAERVYPTTSLRRYKNKFAPSWEQRWLVVPRRRQLPGGLRAVVRSYCPDGLWPALRSNG